MNIYTDELKTDLRVVASKDLKKEIEEELKIKDPEEEISVAELSER